MQAAAFSGWTTGCIGALNSQAWSQITADQLSYITTQIASCMVKQRREGRREGEGEMNKGVWKREEGERREGERDALNSQAWSQITADQLPYLTKIVLDILREMEYRRIRR